jgi:hypothetical protein
LKKTIIPSVASRDRISPGTSADKIRTPRQLSGDKLVPPERSMTPGNSSEKLSTLGEEKPVTPLPSGLSTPVNNEKSLTPVGSQEKIVPSTPPNPIPTPTTPPSQPQLHPSLSLSQEKLVNNEKSLTPVGSQEKILTEKAKADPLPPLPNVDNVDPSSSQIPPVRNITPSPSPPTPSTPPTSDSLKFQPRGSSHPGGLASPKGSGSLSRSAATNPPTLNAPGTGGSSMASSVSAGNVRGERSERDKQPASPRADKSPQRRSGSPRAGASRRQSQSTPVSPRSSMIGQPSSPRREFDSLPSRDTESGLAEASKKLETLKEPTEALVPAPKTQTGADSAKVSASPGETPTQPKSPRRSSAKRSNQDPRPSTSKEPNHLHKPKNNLDGSQKTEITIVAEPVNIGPVSTSGGTGTSGTAIPETSDGKKGSSKPDKKGVSKKANLGISDDKKKTRDSGLRRFMDKGKKDKDKDKDKRDRLSRRGDDDYATDPSKKIDIKNSSEVIINTPEDGGAGGLTKPMIVTELAEGIGPIKVEDPKQDKRGKRWGRSKSTVILSGTREGRKKLERTESTGRDRTDDGKINK